MLTILPRDLTCQLHFAAQLVTAVMGDFDGRTDLHPVGGTENPHLARSCSESPAGRLRSGHGGSITRV